MSKKISELDSLPSPDSNTWLPVAKENAGEWDNYRINAGNLGGGGSNVTVASSPPATASSGDLWYDDTNTKLYVYVTGSANAWVQTNGSSGSGTGGGSGSSGGSGLGSKYVANWASSHGGVTVANGATLAITHNLDDDDAIIQVYVADDITGANAQTVKFSHWDGNVTYGHAIKDKAKNTVNIQLANSGYINIGDSGSKEHTNFTGKFIKVIALSTISGSGGGSGGGDSWVSVTASEGEFIDDLTPVTPEWMDIDVSSIVGTEDTLALTYWTATQADNYRTIEIRRTGDSHPATGYGGAAPTLAGSGATSAQLSHGGGAYLLAPITAGHFEARSPWQSGYTGTIVGYFKPNNSSGSGGSSSSGPGLGIEFFDTVEILTDDLTAGTWASATGDWVTVPSDSAWAGADNIIISVGLFDGDQGGNTGQAFEVRANSNSTSVEVLRHHGTSNDRSATVVQAIIPINSDGTWQYRHAVMYGSYARIKYLRASGKVSASTGGSGGGASVTTAAVAPSNPTDGDLWFDESNAELYVYTDAVNGWVQTNGGSGSSGAGSGSTSSTGGSSHGGSVSIPQGFVEQKLIYSSLNNSMGQTVLIDNYIFEITYGANSGGCTLTQLTTSGHYLQTICPKIGAGNSPTGWSWPYINYSGWAPGWPSMFLDMHATTTATAVIWVKFHHNHVFKMRMNRATGACEIEKMAHTTHGGLNHHFDIIATVGDTLYSHYGFESGSYNATGSLTVWEAPYNSTGKSYANVATKYLQSLKNIDATQEHNPTPEHNFQMIMGVNDVTGRIYIQNRGFNDFVSVYQIEENSSGLGYYQAFANGLQASGNIEPTGSASLSYIKSWSAPSTIGYQAGPWGTSVYRVLFNPDDGTPLAIVKGGHGGGWHYGGTKMFAWDPSWT